VEAVTPHFRLVLGLGNPGRDYAATRHNIGFMILDHHADRAGFAFRLEARWNAAVATHGGVTYAKPLTYMNLSGRPARAISDFYKIEPSAVLVVLDDAALPLGKLRLRADGSAGGHNGLQSILEHLGTRDVARLRVGIGAPGGGEMSDHVLGRFSAEEKPELEMSVARAAEALHFAQQNGLAAAMNQFN
jgi:PTH1 family peptidyl-tRNA hydrolase